eukprot:scaffold128091_cov18-Prasinocladus_malaysianus.AAC.1
MQRGFYGERLAGGSTTECTPTRTTNMHFVPYVMRRNLFPSGGSHCRCCVRCVVTNIKLAFAHVQTWMGSCDRSTRSKIPGDMHAGHQHLC